MSWRERFREDNELLFRLFGRRTRIAFLYIAVCTFCYQAQDRWERCHGVTSCSISYAKGVVWSAAWPIYWINRLTDDPIGLVFAPWRSR